MRTKIGRWSTGPVAATILVLSLIITPSCRQSEQGPSKVEPPKAEMIAIPGGEFVMGDGSGEPDEAPETVQAFLQSLLNGKRSLGGTDLYPAYVPPTHILLTGDDQDAFNFLAHHHGG